MKIWINRAGQNLGTFTLEEVQRGLNQGQYVPTDLGWQEGMVSWKPLAEFADLQMPAPEAPLGALTIPPFSSDVPPPMGEETLTTMEGGEDGPAWERRKELGLLKALTETWKEVLFNPGVSFSRMRASGGFAAPFLFNLTMTIPYTFFTIIYQVLGTWGIAVAAQHDSSNSLSGFNTGMSPLFNVIVMVVALPLTLGLTFVTAGITHLFLGLFKGTSKSYEATYRVICYSSSAYIFAIVPCAGGIILPVWWFVSAIIGLSKVHKTEGWRAAVALLLPPFICIGLVAAVYITIFAIGLAEFHHANT
jgi:hypothetical protein